MLFYAYCLIATLASAPFFARHIHSHLWPVFVAGYCILLILGGRMLLRRRSAPRTPFVAMLLVLLLTLVTLYLYPSTTRVEHPSGGTGAMKMLTAKLIHGHDPYNSVGNESHNLSPGPGWVMLNAPVVAMGKVELVVPLWLTLASLAMFWFEASSVLPFVVLTLVQLDFLQMSFVGDDIFAISLAFVFISVASYKLRDHLVLLILLALIAGAAATARAPTVGALIPITIGLYKALPRAGVWFGAVSFGTAAVIHTAFFAWTVHDGVFYQPLHVFHRASSGAGLVIACCGGLVALACVALSTRLIQQEPKSWMVWNWLMLSAAFVPIGLGELIRVDHFNWAAWEGKNYVSFALALLCAALCIERSASSAAGRT